MKNDSATPRRARTGKRRRRPPPDLAAVDPAAVVAQARVVRGLRARRARVDASAFCSFVLRDERSGARIRQAPMHERWHRLLDEHARAIFWSHVEAGKTSQLAVGRVLWELGRDPNLRVLVVSNTADMARKIVRLIGQYITKSPELRMCFPRLLPTDDPALPWKSQSLTVRRVGVGSKDPSVQACGVHGNVLGSRVDLLVMDDVLDHENTSTPAPREDAYRWVRSTPFSRLTDGARVWCIGNAWHPDDLMHRLAKEPQFLARRFPVVDARGELTWPERFPPERIEARRRDLGPLEFARQMLCQARDDSSARFKGEWVDACIARGKGLRVVDRIEQAWSAPLPSSVLELTEDEREAAEAAGLDPEADPGVLRGALDALWRLGKAYVFTGVDLAVQRRDAADLTALFTLLVEEDGSRRPLCIEAGRWTGPEIIRRIENTHERFGSIFVVENNASQHYIVQFLRDRSAIPVLPFTTGRNKAHPEFGIEGLGAEMAAGKWRIPNQNGRLEPEIAEWVQEVLFYDPREHVGDRLMASWFAREGARRYADRTGASAEVRVRCF